MMTKSKLPILYSYRRCPYAMRARMALKLAGVEVEIREISLRDKPVHMLQISPKGTVPVLVLADGRVIDESLAIIEYVTKNNALESSWILTPRAYELIGINDSTFKKALDGYKYPARFPQKSVTEQRKEGEIFLQQCEDLLQKTDYLLGQNPSLADIAIFPFIRQFAAVDDVWWLTQPYPKLYIWLSGWIKSDLFNSVMTKNPTYVG